MFVLLALLLGSVVVCFDLLFGLTLGICDLWCVCCKLVLRVLFFCG